jgi:hypothetical protein
LSLNGSGGANTTIHGNFWVAGGGGYTVGNTHTTTIDGRVFAGGDSSLDTLTWNSGDTLSDETAVPEPGTWATMAGGAIALVWLRRRRTKSPA